MFSAEQAGRDEGGTSMPDKERQSAGAAAVLRRFPFGRCTIEDLRAHSEDFRDMCEELADAEQALLAADVLPLPIREERRAEWVATIERLTAEIESALNEANVIRVGWAGHLKGCP
jgi:hypothetical protein